MQSASPNAGTPAQTKNRPPHTQPAIFDWYENRVEDALQKLHKVDLSERQKLIEIIEEMEDSNMFCRLLVKFEDSFDQAADHRAEHDCLMALLARVYIAGSLRSAPAIDSCGRGGA